MLDRKTYDRIINYLDKGKLEELKLYLNDELNNGYINKAVKAIKNYNNKKTLQGVNCITLPGNKLLLVNNESCFLLNSTEIDNYLTKTGYSLSSECITNNEEKYLRLLNNSKNEIFEDVITFEDGIIEDDEIKIINPVYNTEESFKNSQKVLVVKSEHDTIGKCFAKDVISFSHAMLGNEATYQMNIDKPELIANSNKGKGYILGLRLTGKDK